MLNRNHKEEDFAQLEALRKWKENHPIDFAGDEPYTTKTFVVAVVLVFVIISGAFFFAGQP